MTLEQSASTLETRTFQKSITNANHSTAMLVEKLKHVQLLTTFTVFYRNRTFISVVTTAYHVTIPSQLNLDQTHTSDFHMTHFNMLATGTVILQLLRTLILCLEAYFSCIL